MRSPWLKSFLCRFSGAFCSDEIESLIDILLRRSIKSIAYSFSWRFTGISADKALAKFKICYNVFASLEHLNAILNNFALHRHFPMAHFLKIIIIIN